MSGSNLARSSASSRVRGLPSFVSTEPCPFWEISDIEDYTDSDLDGMPDVCDSDDDDDGFLDDANGDGTAGNCVEQDPCPSGTEVLCDPYTATACDLQLTGAAVVVCDSPNDHRPVICDDNCQYVPNPDQTNTDMFPAPGPVPPFGPDDYGDACDDDDDNDGVPDGEDCAPTNPFASTEAGPAEDLGWMETGDSTMNWVKGQGATFSNIYRGDLTMGVPASWTCLQSNIFGTTHNDTDVPDPDQGYSYVISSENSCGETEAGTDSEGDPRYPEFACP